MIDKEVFLQQMALLADRIGRTLAGPTQREYLRVLSSALSTEQFLAATTLAFSKWSGEFRAWPSPQQLIELVAPVAQPALTASEAFEVVLDVTNKPQLSHEERRRLVQELGASALRAFRAAGGLRDFDGVLESDIPWLRRRFVEAYENACEHADAERAATLAIGDADRRVAALVGGIAAAKALPPARKIG